MIQPSGSESPIKEPERSGIERIEKYVPGIGLIRTYKKDLLKTDVVAAATVLFSFPQLSPTVSWLVLSRWLDYMLLWSA